MMLIIFYPQTPSANAEWPSCAPNWRKMCERIEMRYGDVGVGGEIRPGIRRFESRSAAPTFGLAGFLAVTFLCLWHGIGMTLRRARSTI